MVAYDRMKCEVSPQWAGNSLALRKSQRLFWVLLAAAVSAAGLSFVIG